MELLIMAERRCAGHAAARVTAVSNPFRLRSSGPSQQSAHTDHGARWCENMMVGSGIERILTMGSCNAAQIQGFFDIPSTNALCVRRGLQLDIQNEFRVAWMT